MDTQKYCEHLTTSQAYLFGPRDNCHPGTRRSIPQAQYTLRRRNLVQVSTCVRVRGGVASCIKGTRGERDRHPNLKQQTHFKFNLSSAGFQQAAIFFLSTSSPRSDFPIPICYRSQVVLETPILGSNPSRNAPNSIDRLNPSGSGQSNSNSNCSQFQLGIL